VYLKLNSGMNRLGFGPAAFRAAWRRLSGLTQVDAITLMTHFANADRAPGVDDAMAVFEAAVADLPGERSLCNSAATLRHAPASAALRGDWVRPGIMLYGSSPDHPAHTGAQWDLQPAMTLRTRLIGTQALQAGSSVGYGSLYTAEGPLRIGVAACGYADGYPRHAPTGTPVLVDGVRTRLIGRVSMDMVAIDLTPVPHAGPGSEVTLWGQGPGGSVLPIDEVAHAAGTVGYELMCALAPRVPVSVGR
jgi:alanine racemase